MSQNYSKGCMSKAICRPQWTSGEGPSPQGPLSRLKAPSVVHTVAAVSEQKDGFPQLDDF